MRAVRSRVFGGLGLGLGFGLGLALALPSVAAAQADPQTLADIRQDLTVLYGQIQGLKHELSTTSGPTAPVEARSVLDRVDAIEAELQRLTAKTEELGNRVSVVVKDGTNRIGDLEFRLCELEPGCDVGKLGDTPTLGGGTMPQAPVAARPATKPQVQMAVGEQADFDRAKAALDSGSFRAAADQFAAFAETYPAGPLTAPAHVMRGEALAGLGETPDAAKAYLHAFSADPKGPEAPKALLRLGQSLGDLGQTDEACVTLDEVGVRFPGTPAAGEAQSSRTRLGCP
ncbi:tol-pal system protein YbgF [Tropicimonas sp. IMCC34043]|uniref:tol-pal system protein YbgF n=1 Tax=Tropicimonas sp. IMCC34043 TaxID=2248760 RepID=UPI000E245B84|nr:tol-pal system protein YbgF [Tropicimonas sp. IMCC34043]